MSNSADNKLLYPDVDSNPNFVDLEQNVLKNWKENNTFQSSIKGEKEYVFFDGPPFANGLPHAGHLLTGYIKDIFARYHTMLGEKVHRRFGWDCHGLPAEMAVEKELGISGGLAIENYGIDKFNAKCEKSVLKYTSEWKDYVERQARWVDFENSYKTMDRDYMESVLWAFKSLYDKGLIYETMRVMPYSWACETPVSNFETRMDNAYREKASKAVTVTFKLKDVPENLSQYNDCRVLVWTTTPWTLPSNLAIAVGEDIEYSCVEKEGVCYIIATSLMSQYEKEIGSNVVQTIKGKELIGMQYHPILPYFKDHKNAFQVLSAEFVTTEDGTGIVHMAPGFGEDDEVVCKEHGIEVVCPVDSTGKFIHPVEEFAGVQVFDANDDIIKKLKLDGSWVKTEQYLHNYPHCWRTDTPLIYKAVPSWYLKVTDIKEKMIKNNQQINWIPGHIKNGSFGKWLENARDWSISRNRYWGCPIPIWQSDDPKYPHLEVYGSIKELEEAFDTKVEDLHRPFIDTLTKPNPSDPTGKSMLRRVPYVLDCWFESGSMPYAQLHYPFENKERFEKSFPADFITEYLAQTRGWFYTMMVLSTALFDKPPFKNVICHGVILGGDGQKLSKRLKNYADPNEVFDVLGADAMRWYLVSTPVMRGQEVLIDKEGKVFKEVVRLAIKPIWNAYKFFTLYANADKVKAEFSLESNNLMDQYILSKCCQTVNSIKLGMDGYDTISSTAAIEEFFEVLNNWYIRRSRERFWRSGVDQDKVSAYNTLYTVLHMVCRAAAPLLPLTLEKIYQGLTGEQSVHLAKFPDTSEFVVNDLLIKDMERVRDACNSALHIRNEAGIRTRQPLSKVTFIGVSQGSISDELTHLILDEVNVKSWDSLKKEKLQDFANYKLKLLFPVIGKRLPNKMKTIIAANKNNEWDIVEGNVQIAGEILEKGEFELKLEAKAEYKENIVALSSNDALVMLDLNLSEKLKLEGMARDFTRAIQNARKQANFNISDYIVIHMNPNDQLVKDMVKEWEGYINEQTLSIAISYEELDDVSYRDSVKVEDLEIHFAINKK